MKTLAIIPARGGSKRVFRKNLKSLFQKPLIAHTIEIAKKSKVIDKVVVSTEDSTIKKISKRYLCDVIDRPEELAGDKVSTEAVIKDVLQKEKGYDTIILLQCTSPMKIVRDIDDAFEYYEKGGFDSVLSVTPSNKILWEEIGKVGNPITYEDGKRPTRSQDIDYFEENGAIYIFSKEGFLKNNSRVFGAKGLYVMPKERSIDIDTKEDFDYLEWKYGNRER